MTEPIETAASPLSAEDRQTLKRAKAISAAGDHAAAIELVRALVKSDPANFDGWYVLAKLQFAASDVARAARSIRRAIAIRRERKAVSLRRKIKAELGALPNDDRALLKSAKAMSAAGDHDEAIDRVQRLIDRAPDNFDGWYVLAKLQLAAGQADDADQSVKRAIAIRREPKALALAGKIQADNSEIVWL